MKRALMTDIEVEWISVESMAAAVAGATAIADRDGITFTSATFSFCASADGGFARLIYLGTRADGVEVGLPMPLCVK